jgi:hypothetical protein
VFSSFPYRWARFGLGFVQRLNPAAHFRYGMGITVTGAGVSQWNDQTANGRHLKQGTDANRPALQADGSILFDGLAHFLKCDAFTLAQPETVYILFRQVTWTSGEKVYDGNTLNAGTHFQRTAGASPELAVHAGSTVGAITDIGINTYGVTCCVFNGASSSIQGNSGAPTVGNAGAAGMGGFTLGASGASTLFGNIQVKEVIIYADAHDALTRTKVIRYLGRVGELGLL